jgi:hypothetical protein
MAMWSGDHTMLSSSMNRCQSPTELDLSSKLSLNGSARRLSDVSITSPSVLSRSSSTSSIRFAEGEVDVVTAEGLRHIATKLNAR